MSQSALTVTIRQSANRIQWPELKEGVSVALTDEGLMEAPDMLSRWIRLANGERAHYMTAGEKGPAVVLLHDGLPGSSGLAGWRLLAPRIAKAGFRVYCPDLPGFGISDPRPEYWPIYGSYSQAMFLEQFAEAMCLEQFFLAGNSMGSFSAAHYLVRYPHRVKRYILIAGPVGDLLPADPPFGLPSASDDTRPTPGWDGTRPTVKKLLKSVVQFKNTVSADLVEMHMRSADRQRQSWMAWQRAAVFAQTPPDIAGAMSTRDRLDRIDIPGLYLHGQNDAIMAYERPGCLFEDALTKVQFFYPKDCGHQGQTDQPTIFAQIFIEFFGEGHVSRATADQAGISTRRPELTRFVAPRAPTGPAAQH